MTALGEPDSEALAITLEIRLAGHGPLEVAARGDARLAYIGR